MKTTHAVLLVVLAVVAGGLLFVRMHNPAAFDRLLGGSASVPPNSQPTLPAKFAAPAVKAIDHANATADKVLHATDNKPAPGAGKLANAKPPTKPTVDKPANSPAKPSVVGSPEPNQSTVFAASAPTVMPYSSATTRAPSVSSIMNSPSDVINAPIEPTTPESPSQPSANPTDTGTPLMSAAPADSTPTSAAAWIPPSPTPAQPNWTWTTTGGQVYKKVKVVKMDPQSITILHEDGGATVPMDTLPPELQKLFNYDPAAAAQWTVGKLVSGNLVMLRNGTVQSVNDAQLRSARYIAVYYSAAWCEPCEEFTPRLVKFYNDFKPTHPEFEILFISEDRNAAAMATYMRKASMPWLAVTYDSLIHPPGQFKGSGIEAFAGHEIPDLVLLDATGRVLSDSYRGGRYIGPEAVIRDIESTVK